VKFKKVYLDYAATTPTDLEVLKAMKPFFQKKFGNPSSIHSFGQEAKAEVENAREKVAFLINAEPDEIIFTSGGTESNNLAIFGITEQISKKGKIITSSIEHPSVLKCTKKLKEDGYKIKILSVDRYGKVNLKELKKELTNDTILVSIIYGNNEIGTLQDIEEISNIVKEKKIILYTDAVQAVGNVEVNVQDLNVDLLSFSSHKIYGPKGTGALFVKKGVKLKEMIYGGEQEAQKRAGTENVCGIVGFGKACEITKRKLKERNKKLKTLREYFIKKIKKEIKDIIINGHPKDTLPNIVNVSFLGVDGEGLLLALDLKGIAVSSGSACASGAMEASSVLLAIGLSEEVAKSSLRFSFGKDTTFDEINYTVKILKKLVYDFREKYG
jgi:cysteine desulfurase